jgi:uncharacterized protein (TIGR02996 family)
VSDDPQRLVRAVIEAPDDDAPRLVYADWLREQGQIERAELIRMQCAGQEPEVRLLEQNRQAWIEVLGPDVSELRFERGFPVFVRLCLQHPGALAILDQAPLRRLMLAPPEEEDEDPLPLVAAIVDDPRLDRLEGLNLQGPWGSALIPLLTRPRWRGLRSLTVDDADCSPDLVQALTDPGIGMENVEELVLGGDYQGELGPAGLAPLLASPVLARLRSLSLLNLSLGPEDALALAEAGLTRLQSLDLGWGSYNPNRVGSEGVRALAASASLGGLTQLLLPFNSVGDDGLAALAGSHTLDNLAYLSLQGNSLGDEGLRALAEGEGMAGLAHLELTWNRDITARGLAALVRSPRFRRIQTLWIRQCAQIGPEGAQALASSPASQGLRDLNLLECGLGPEGGLALARSPYLDGLQKLQVCGNHLDEESRRALVERFGDRVDASR